MSDDRFGRWIYALFFLFRSFYFILFYFFGGERGRGRGGGTHRSTLLLYYVGIMLDHAIRISYTKCEMVRVR